MEVMQFWDRGYCHVLPCRAEEAKQFVEIAGKR